MLNLHSFFEGKGVEFRCFQFDNFDSTRPVGRRGGLHAGQLKSYVQLCLAMNYRALHTRAAKYQPLQSENQRYTMRCWLLRLGFIGDEFATARRVLTYRLPGDTAWRNGRPTQTTKLNKSKRLSLYSLASCNMGVPELIYSHFKKNKRR